MAVVAAFAAAGCQVSRQSAPIGVGFLQAREVVRASDRAALSPIAWSPDGRRFAYGARDGVWIHTVGDIKGAKIADGEVVTAVAWSRVADAIAYIDRGALWIVRPDGRGRRAIPIAGVVSRPVWAPGGDRLAVVVQPAGQNTAQLWLTGPQGAAIRQILWDPRGRWVGALGWFPNALYLFVGLARPDADATVEWWRVRIVYPDFRRLEGPKRPALDPMLSPSGDWIAFLAQEDGRERAYAVRPDGSGAHPLSAPAGRAVGLGWSSSGDKVAYALAIDETRVEIRAAGASAGAQQTLATVRLERADPRAGISLAWSPDESHLAYGTNTGVSSGAVWLLRFAPR
ncbi:MAG: hypothetical protein ACRDGN_05525 [bacterium]